MQDFDNERRAYELLREQIGNIRHLLEDDEVVEIQCNGPGAIYYQKKGQLIRDTNAGLDANNIALVIKYVASLMRKTVKTHGTHADDFIVDAQVMNMRFAGVRSPISDLGDAFTIRKHVRSSRVLSDYLKEGAFDRCEKIVNPDHVARPTDKEIAQGGEGLFNFFKWAVQSKKNLIVAGATDSGKTTFLNALLQFIPLDERLITIEDVKELFVPQENVVRLIANHTMGIDIHRLLKVCLRFSPHRICVGEVRGQEAFDLIDALNTGHSGSAVSLHADSAFRALSRLENMVRKSPDSANMPIEVLREQISQTFQYVIFNAKHGAMRCPFEVIEILGYENGQYVYKDLYRKFL